MNHGRESVQESVLEWVFIRERERERSNSTIYKFTVFIVYWLKKIEK